MRLLITLLLILSLSTPIYGEVEMDKDEDGHYLGVYDVDVQEQVDEISIVLCIDVVDAFIYKGKTYYSLKKLILDILED